MFAVLVFIYTLLFSKMDFIINQNSMGKKCIGITKPGNNSGCNVPSGNGVPNVPKMETKDNTKNSTENTKSVFAPNQIELLPKPVSKSSNQGSNNRCCHNHYWLGDFRKINPQIRRINHLINYRNNACQCSCQ